MRNRAPSRGAGSYDQDVGDLRRNLDELRQLIDQYGVQAALPSNEFFTPRAVVRLMRDAAVVQFPVTVGVWAIFVLLFVKLK